MKEIIMRHDNRHRHRSYPRHYRSSYGMSYGGRYGRRPGWGFSWILFPMFFWFIWGGGFWMFPLGIILLFWLLPVIMGAVNNNQAAVMDQMDQKEKGMPSYDDADDYVDDYEPAYADEEYFETVDGQRLRVVDDDGSQTRLTIG